MMTVRKARKTVLESSVTSSHSRRKVWQREVEQRDYAIHRNINRRRGRHGPPPPLPHNMYTSIALAALDHDPRRIHRGPRGLEYA